VKAERGASAEPARAQREGKAVYRGALRIKPLEVFENSLSVGIAEPLERVSAKRAPDCASVARVGVPSKPGFGLMG